MLGLLFRKIRFKNLMSYGNNFVEFDLTSNKSILFQGESGSGKSVLLSAMVFCLFGKPFTNIRKANLINSINGSNLVVELEFSIGNKDFKVIRGIKPNIFEIYEDGNLITQSAANIDYQELLETQILKFNLRTFLQIVVLGSANFTPFMQLSAGERRAVNEEILDIVVFTMMNELQKQDAIELKGKSKELENKKNLLETEINLHNSYKEKAEAENEARKLEIQESIVKLKETNIKIENGIKDTIEKHDIISKDKTKILSAITQLKNAISSNDVKKNLEISAAEKQLKYFSSHENCELCLQNIESDHKTSIIDKLNTDKAAIDEKYKKENEDLSKKIVALESSEALKKIIAKDEAILKALSLLKEKNSLNSLKIRTLSDELRSFKTQKKPVEDQVELKRKLLAEVEAEYSEVLSNLQICEYASTLLKDNGIKTDIIREYLPLINQSINDYLSKMNFPAMFTFDENFSEKIESHGKSDFEYNCFSEGEKQRLDLAILFTWRKIAQIKNSLNCNLLIIDEIADSKLSNTGAEDVWDVLKSPEFDTSNIFVISHKNTISNKFERVYNFSKKGNFTQVEEYNDN